MIGVPTNIFDLWMRNSTHCSDTANQHLLIKPMNGGSAMAHMSSFCHFKAVGLKIIFI